MQRANLSHDATGHSEAPSPLPPRPRLDAAQHHTHAGGPARTRCAMVAGQQLRSHLRRVVPGHREVAGQGGTLFKQLNLLEQLQRETCVNGVAGPLQPLPYVPGHCAGRLPRRPKHQHQQRCRGQAGAHCDRKGQQPPAPPHPQRTTGQRAAHDGPQVAMFAVAWRLAQRNEASRGGARGTSGSGRARRSAGWLASSATAGTRGAASVLIQCSMAPTCSQHGCSARAVVARAISA